MPAVTVNPENILLADDDGVACIPKPLEEQEVLLRDGKSMIGVSDTSNQG